MVLTILTTWLAASAGVFAQKPPLLPAKDVAAMANELSGETAKRNLEAISRFHRQRGSTGFHSAAELVAERLRAYGLSNIEILQFPADGKIFYGTQRSRPAWDAEFAELWQVAPEIVSCEEAAGRNSVTNAEQPKAHSGVMSACDKIIDKPIRKLASYEEQPVVLAEDSESADVTADLIDVGEGTKESDYAGKEVKGKIVLVSAQPGAVQDLAVGRYGAAGIVSYAQNQKTAWRGDDQNLVRWGHLDTFSASKTFAFMVSLKTGRGMQDWLAQPNRLLRLHAVVKAGQHPGNYEVVTATIPGADPKLKDEEIAFSCHLDHQLPGANDNASGCATILEIARTLQKLIVPERNTSAAQPSPTRINQERLAQPARTIRFIFPPEVEGTMALLNAKPEFARRIKAVIHMDMVAGGPETKAVFHVTRGPMSLPSFVHDIAWAFADWVNEESYKFAATGDATYPMVAPEGGKESLRAEYVAFTMGSDHDVYQDSSFGIPAIYLNDWPDRYIHTNFDSATNIDSTKLKRAALIGAASGYFIARTSTDELIPQAWQAVKQGRAARTAQELSRANSLDRNDQLIQEAGVCSYELGFDIGVDEETVKSVATSHCPIFYTPKVPFPTRESAKKLRASPQGLLFRRKKEPKGPLAVFGYDYFAEHAKAAGIATPKLLSYEGLWGGGEEYAYEVLNFADGKRDVQQIRDAVSAEYGPVPFELVSEYLTALEKIGILEKIK
jgi:hypothetical protein